jgi:hypothetical protein
MKINLMLALRLIGIISLVVIPCEGAVKRIVKVSSKTELGFSREVTAEVTFATGSELTAIAPQMRVDHFELYALIWFKDGKVAIVKLKDKPLLMGLSGFNAENFKDLYFLKSEIEGTQVNGNATAEPRTWRFKAKEIITWIDPRVED